MTEHETPHPDWEPEDGPLEGDEVAISASSLGDAIAKPQIDTWRVTEGSKRVMEEWPMLTELRATNPDMAREWIEDAPFHQHRDKMSARDRGTALHAWLEAHYRGLPLPSVPEYLWGHLSALSKWVDQSGFVPDLMEQAVWRNTSVVPDTEALAGRVDLNGHGLSIDTKHYAIKPSDLCLLDVKTSEVDATPAGRKRKPYPDVTLQQAAYFYADLMYTTPARTISKGKARLYLMSQEERELAVPYERPDHSLILYVTPEACRLYPLAMSEAHLDAALAAARIWWHNSSVKGYVGRSIMEVEA